MSEMVERTEEQEHFEVDNDLKAEWCLSKIRKIRAEQSRMNEELDRQMQFFVAQKEANDRKADESVQFFNGLLRKYFESRIEDGFVRETKTKVCYKLPTGELVLKHREPQYDKKETVVLEWLKANGETGYIKSKESLDWAEFKKTLRFTESGEAVNDDGEIVPGIKAVAMADEFVVEVKK